MKRFLILLIISLQVLLLSACKNEEVFGDYSLTYSFSENSAVHSSNSEKEEASTLELSSNTKCAEQHEIVSFKNTIYAGDKANIKIKGLPSTDYSIAVFYSSGQSKSKDLITKSSNENGVVFWEWRVGFNTKPGCYSLIISKSSEQVIKTEFNVISRDAE